MNLDTGTYIFTSVRNHLDLDAMELKNDIETKNTWARDDPAILILLSACLCGGWDVNTAIASCPEDLFSCSCGLVRGIFLRFSGLLQTRTAHDPAGFSSRGYDRSHNILVSPSQYDRPVELNIVQGVLEQRPSRPSVPLDCGRLQSRVGIRI